MVERVLNIEAVEDSERFRTMGWVADAARLAADGMDLVMSGPLSDEEIAVFAQDVKKRAVLACLARLHVVSLTSIANKAFLPRWTYFRLEQAEETVSTVYQDAALRESLEGVTEDHKEREHHFLPEMARDEARLLFASSVLYPGEQADHLIELGEGILQMTYDSLPDGHPTKHLIGIEIQLSLADRGEEINKEGLLADFRRLKRIYRETNPDRLLTVASWMVVWGEKLGDEEIGEAGQDVFQSWSERGVDLKQTLRNERKKMGLRDVRRFAYRFITPKIVGSDRLIDLKRALHTIAGTDEE